MEKRQEAGGRPRKRRRTSRRTEEGKKLHDENGELYKVHDIAGNVLDAAPNSGGLQRPSLPRMWKARALCTKLMPMWSHMACVSNTQRGPT